MGAEVKRIRVQGWVAFDRHDSPFAQPYVERLRSASPTRLNAITVNMIMSPAG